MKLHIPKNHDQTSKLGSKFKQLVGGTDDGGAVQATILTSLAIFFIQTLVIDRFKGLVVVYFEKGRVEILR
jgi:hypothetical protein